MFIARPPTFQTTVALWHCPNGDGVYTVLSAAVAAQLYTTRWKQALPLFINEIDKERGPLARQEGPAFQLLLLPADTANVQLLDPFSQPHDWHGLVVHSDALLGEKLYLIDYIEVRWQGWPNQHYGLLLRRISRSEDPREQPPTAPDTWCVDVEGFVNGTCLSCDGFNIHVEMPQLGLVTWESEALPNPCAPPATYRWELSRNAISEVFTLLLRTSDNVVHATYQSQLVGWQPGDPLTFTLQTQDAMCDYPLGLIGSNCAPEPPQGLSVDTNPGVFNGLCNACSILSGIWSMDKINDNPPTWVNVQPTVCYPPETEVLKSVTYLDGVISVEVSSGAGLIVRWAGDAPNWDFSTSVSCDKTVDIDEQCNWPFSVVVG